MPADPSIARGERGVEGGGARWWLLLPPTVPLVVAALLVQFIGPADMGTVPAPGESAAPEPAGFRHLGDRITFAAAVSLHLTVCAGALGYYAWLLRAARPRFRRALHAAPLGLGAVVLAALATSAHLEPVSVIHHYTYGNIRDLFEALAATEDLTRALPGLGLSRLALYVLLPSALGIFSVTFAAAAVVFLVHSLASAGEAAWEEELRDCHDTLFRCFYVLSAVLVTSTLAASAFFHMPVGLLAAEAESAGALRAYADGLTLFWGTVFTLTLLAVFAAPLLILWRQAQGYAARTSGVRDRRAFHAWLAERGLQKRLAEQLQGVGALLAPLLVGPLGTLLETLGG